MIDDYQDSDVDVEVYEYDEPSVVESLKDIMLRRSPKVKSQAQKKSFKEKNIKILRKAQPGIWEIKHLKGAVIKTKMSESQTGAGNLKNLKFLKF